MKLSAVVIAAGLAFACPAQAQAQGALAEARAISAALLAGDARTVIARSSPEFIAERGGETLLRAFVEKLPVQMGKEGRLDHDRLTLRKAGPRYIRIVAVEKGPPLLIDIGFDAATGLITSLLVKPARDKGVAVAPRAAKTRLTLPFGTPPTGHVWSVTNAGVQVIDNYHARLDTYYAIDVSPRTLNAKMDVTTPAESPCWGLPIIAAAPANVSVARDGIVDQSKLDEPDNSTGPCNHVILDHGNGEFTLYAHLRNGSVAVRAGTSVERGTRLGVCGNSGGSSGPHLHFQLMDGINLDTARGIPPVFHDYFAPVRYVERGTLARGDVVLPAPSLRAAR